MTPELVPRQSDEEVKVAMVEFVSKCKARGLSDQEIAPYLESREHWERYRDRKSKVVATCDEDIWNTIWPDGECRIKVEYIHSSRCNGKNCWLGSWDRQNKDTKV